jgi:hypothetical protein
MIIRWSDYFFIWLRLFWLNFIFEIKIIFYYFFLMFDWNTLFRFRFRRFNISYINNTLLLWSCSILLSHIYYYYFLFLDFFMSLSLLKNRFTLFWLLFWILRLTLWLLLLRFRFILMFFLFFFFFGLTLFPKICYKFSQMLKKLFIFICCILRKLIWIILVIL